MFFILLGFLFRPFFERSGAAFDYSFFFENTGYCAEEAFAVEGKAHVLDVFAVVGGFYGYRQLVAAVYLRPAGEAREYIVGAVFVALGYKVLLVPERGTRADDGHFARCYAPDLRQFIEREFTKPSAAFRYPSFRIVQHMRRHVCWRICVHSAEFRHHESRFVYSNALLPEEDRTVRVQLYDNGNSSHRDS